MLYVAHKALPGEARVVAEQVGSTGRPFSPRLTSWKWARARLRSWGCVVAVAKWSCLLTKERLLEKLDAEVGRSKHGGPIGTRVEFGGLVTTTGSAAFIDGGRSCVIIPGPAEMVADLSEVWPCSSARYTGAYEATPYPVSFFFPSFFFFFLAPALRGSPPTTTVTIAAVRLSLPR